MITTKLFTIPMSEKIGALAKLLDCHPGEITPYPGTDVYGLSDCLFERHPHILAVYTHEELRRCIEHTIRDRLCQTDLTMDELIRTLLRRSAKLYRVFEGQYGGVYSNQLNIILTDDLWADAAPVYDLVVSAILENKDEKEWLGPLGKNLVYRWGDNPNIEKLKDGLAIIYPYLRVTVIV